MSTHLTCNYWTDFVTIIPCRY